MIAEIVIRTVAAAALAAAAAACGTGVPQSHRETVIDSVRPREVALAEFRAALPAVDSLGGLWQPSRDSLVRSFMHAVARRDTAALLAMGISQGEFAWLYYPTHPEALPPYDLSPQLMWFTMASHSGRGLNRVLEAYGGRDLRFTGVGCDDAPSRQGPNTVYGVCRVRFVSGNDTMSEQLFGPIVEHRGRFKFASYTNRL